MKLPIALRQGLSVALTILLLPLGGQSQVAEKPQQKLARTASSELSLKTELSKNIFRSEAYQAEYQVDVPYEDTEEYVEDVPYQEEETYTDMEDYIEQEHRCHTVTENESVCREERQCRTRTVNERECHGERRCRPVSENERVCRNENRCHSVPGERVCRDERLCSREPGDNVCQEVEECGNNAQGQRICRTRRVCERGAERENCRNVPRCENGPSRQVCENEQVCENVPRQREECADEQICRDVPRSVEECRNEPVCQNVPRQREVCGLENVTRQRPVTRTRLVTRYRQETRTRTVTRTRSETRCCRTEHRNVFDHQEKLAVDIVFPRESQLANGEKENIQVDWVNESKARLEIDSKIFKYRIAREEMSGSVYRFELAMVPQYSEAELGARSFKAETRWSGGTPKILIEDQGLRPRVETLYRFKVIDPNSGAVLEEGEKKNLNKEKFEIALKPPPQADQTYAVQIQVQRQGIVLAQAIQFDSNTQLLPRYSLEAMGENSILNLKLKIAENSKAEFQFEDRVDLSEVKTAYSFTIHKVSTQELVEQGEGTYTQKKSMKVKLTKAYSLQEKYLLQVRFARKVTGLPNKIEFLKKVEEGVSEIESTPYQNSELLVGFEFKGEGRETELLFQDKSPRDRGVKSTYLLEIQRRGGLLGTSWKSVVKKTLPSEKVQNGNVQLNLAKDLKVDDGELVRQFLSGREFKIILQVQRQHPALNRGQEVKIEKKLTLKL